MIFCWLANCEQVEAQIDEKIEKQLREKEIGMAEMRGEIRLLWAEVEALSKGREEVKNLNVEHLNQIAQIAKENAIREQDILKSENGFLRRQLQTMKQEGIQVSPIHTQDRNQHRDKQTDRIRPTASAMQTRRYV
jgi:hypothetical protein